MSETGFAGGKTDKKLTKQSKCGFWGRAKDVVITSSEHWASVSNPISKNLTWKRTIHIWV
jgi:hypothetical protein